jgi:hypothetical protein
MTDQGLDPDRERPKHRHPRGAAWLAFKHREDDPSLLLPRIQRIDDADIARAFLQVAADRDADAEVRELIASRYHDLRE